MIRWCDSSTSSEETRSDFAEAQRLFAMIGRHSSFHLPSAVPSSICRRARELASLSSGSGCRRSLLWRRRENVAEGIECKAVCRFANYSHQRQVPRATAVTQCQNRVAQCQDGIKPSANLDSQLFLPRCRQHRSYPDKKLGTSSILLRSNVPVSSWSRRRGRYCFGCPCYLPLIPAVKSAVQVLFLAASTRTIAQLFAAEPLAELIRPGLLDLLSWHAGWRSSKCGVGTAYKQDRADSHSFRLLVS